jgi:hypothetical protein
MADPRDGAWYWVLYEGWSGEKQWVPALRERNHWNSAIFRGLSLHEVTVGPELTPPAAAAIEQRAPQVMQPEDELRRLLADEERAHRERMAPYYQALARFESLPDATDDVGVG